MNALEMAGIIKIAQETVLRAPTCWGIHDCARQDIAAAVRRAIIEAAKPLSGMLALELLER